VVGQLQAAAAAAITAAHLVPAINTAASATVATGLVISQAPTGGASAVTGSTVTLLVSLGPAGVQVSVPDVVGRPLADAQSRIAAVGLTSTVTSAHNANVKVGAVISQSPVRDTLVPSGSNVALVVSLGP